MRVWNIVLDSPVTTRVYFCETAKNGQCRLSREYGMGLTSTYSPIGTVEHYYSSPMSWFSSGSVFVYSAPYYASPFVDCSYISYYIMYI